MTRFRKIAIAVAVLAMISLVLGVWLFRGQRDYDLSRYDQRDLDFHTETATLAGTLIVPRGGNSAGPIVLFVHGDGPQDRFLDGGYAPMMNVFLDNGIGVYSWDKAGIGDSTGNWLDQSMNDRATEALAAFDAVRRETGVDNQIGFIGFSQAGWVLPKVALVETDAFYVIVGGATNWQQQGDYYATIRLRNDGKTDAEIQNHVAAGNADAERFFAPPANYETYLANTDDDPPMDEDRFRFVATNYTADSTDELPLITAPILAIFGEDDLNVDATKEAAIYEQALADNNPDNEVVLWPDASHSLLKPAYNYQLGSQWPIFRSITAVADGRGIFAPGVLDFISDWIVSQRR